MRDYFKKFKLLKKIQAPWRDFLKKFKPMVSESSSVILYVWYPETLVSLNVHSLTLWKSESGLHAVGYNKLCWKYGKKRGGVRETNTMIFFFFWWVSGTELRTLFFPGRCYTSQISLPQTMIFDRVIVPFRIMVVQGECKINQWEFRRNTIRAQFILSCNSSMFHQKHTCFYVAKLAQ